MIRLFALKKINYALLVVVLAFVFKETKTIKYNILSLKGSNFFSGRFLQSFSTLQRIANLINPAIKNVVTKSFIK